MGRQTDKLVNKLFRKCLEKVYTNYYSKDNGNIPMEMTFEEYIETISKRTLHGQVIANVYDQYKNMITNIPFEDYVIGLIEESKNYERR